MKIYKAFGMAVLMICGLLLFSPMTVRAAEANAHFGSRSYSKTEGEQFNIGLYLESQETFGDYSLTMTYDPNIMEYVSGATTGGGGSITLSGTADSGYVKVLVSFRAIAAGNTALTITEASALSAEGEAFSIVNQGSVPLSVSADDPLYLSGITINGEELAGFEPQLMDYNLAVPYEMDELEVAAVGNEAVISDTRLEVGENTISLTLSARGGTQTVYLLHVMRQEEIVVPTETPAAPTQAPPSEEPADIAIPTMDYGEEGSIRGLFTSIFTQKVILIPVILMIFAVLGVSTLLTYIEFSREYQREQRRAASAEKRRQEQTPQEQEPTQEQGLEVRNLDDDGQAEWEPQDDAEYAAPEEADESAEYAEQDEDGEDAEQDEEADDGAGYAEQDEGDENAEDAAEQPIIVVDDVCMDFKVAMQNVSGIKEWLIEKVKGKISYRVLHALEHISFEVYPGEVVGIIGTNGSGKSTLLKIVSGVLAPTSGQVVADRSKIQLLTLGTGFDMELTARENVYLNGAIIGYSRSFIDEHYDEIVAFAELEDFMEEKVKNFSSGMVSRLGFAIATAGDAAEILILDEVLSVGDEFFKKKSLARIQEMIHGGSTVLMVSHSMGTIRENCSKAVWIEKGKLCMVGETSRVCDAYQKMERK